MQQHKNSVKRIGEWSAQHQRNKTIWPYSVTDQSVPDTKSLQPIHHQSQDTLAVKTGERNLQQNQSRMTPSLLTNCSGSVNLSGFCNSVVVTSTTNITRRPSRKYSTTIALAEDYVTDLERQDGQPQSLQLWNSSRRLQQHQHQSFMMVATEAIKAQRQMRKRRRCRQKKTVVCTESLISELPPVNLEHVVRHLWCRRHTSELLRKQLSLNNDVDVSICTNNLPTASQHDSVNSSLCSSYITGNGKRRSLFSPSCATTIVSVDLPITTSSLNSIAGGNGKDNSSPHKKCKLEQRVVGADKMSVLPQPLVLPAQNVVSANDHSITAILSGSTIGAKRSSGVIATMGDLENSGINNSTTSTGSTINSVVMSQKNMSPAPLSLLRTLLKSPNNETGSPLPVEHSNGGGCITRHYTGRNRKRSAVEATTLISPVIPPATNTPTEVNSSSSRTTSKQAISTVVGTNAINDTTAALTAFNQLPALHPAAAEQLAAAGYFNVLYHQAAMAAAMVYQSQAQLSQPLSKISQSSPKSPLLSSQFPITGNTVNNNWQRKLNRQPPLLPSPKTMAIRNGITTATVMSPSSTSSIVAPYSSPLATVAVNGSSMLPPATPSPPPLLMHPIHPRHLLLHHMHQQHQYQIAPTLQQPSSYHQNKRQKQGSGIKKKSLNVTECGSGGGIEKKNAVNIKDSSTSVGKCANTIFLNINDKAIIKIRFITQHYKIYFYTQHFF